MKERFKEETENISVRGKERNANKLKEEGTKNWATMITNFCRRPCSLQ